MKPAKQIVICKTAKSDTTKSGLVTHQSATNKPEVGVIIEIGSGELPVEMKVGDKIAYRRYTDNKILIAGEELNFIKFDDVLAVVETK